MGKGKEKWIRFEDGLLKSEYIEKKYAKLKNPKNTQYLKKDKRNPKIKKT